MSRIAEIRGREIIDSRGNPTVEADVVLESGALRPRRGALGRLHRLARGGGAARWRSASAFSARACCKAVEHVNGAIRRVVLGHDAQDQRGLDDKLIARGRHRQQIASSARMRSSRYRSPPRMPPRATARCRCTAILAARGAARHAGADDEHHQRRRARGQQRRHPGVHDPADRRAVAVRGACATARRCSMRSRKFCMPRGSTPPSAMRAASRPTLPSNEAALAADPGGDREGGLPGRAETSIWVSMSPAPSSTRTGVYELESEGRKFNSAEFADYLAALAAKYPIVTIEDGMSEGDWDGWAILTRKARRQGAAGRATMCSSPTPGSSPKASRRKSRTPSSSSRTRSAR